MKHLKKFLNYITESISGEESPKDSNIGAAQINESHNVKSLKDLENIKGVSNLLDKTFQDSMMFASRGIVRPDQEFEGFHKALMRTKQVLMDYKLEYFSPGLGYLLKELNNIMNSRDYREAGEIRRRIHGIFRSFKQELDGLISRIHKEIKTYMNNEGGESSPRM